MQLGQKTPVLDGTLRSKARNAVKRDESTDAIFTTHSPRCTDAGEKLFAPETKFRLSRWF